MTKEELKRIINNAVTLGMIQARDMMLSGMDWISKPQAKNYLRSQGIKTGQLDRWEKEGILKAVQSGAYGTTKYRCVDLQKAVLMATVAATDVE